MDGMSRAEFADAVGASIESVRHFYREVDRLIAGIKEALGEKPEPLSAVRGSTGKGAGLKQQGRLVLRDHYSILFEPADDDAPGDSDDEEDDEQDDGNDDEDVGGRRGKPAELDPEQPLLALLVNLWTNQTQPGFEPVLQYAVLGEWHVGGTRPNSSFAIRRNLLRQIPWILEDPTNQSKRVMTRARAKGTGKGKGKRLVKGSSQVSCQVMGKIHTVALYDLDAPHALDELAIKMKNHWRDVSEP